MKAKRERGAMTLEAAASRSGGPSPEKRASEDGGVPNEDDEGEESSLEPWHLLLGVG